MHELAIAEEIISKASQRGWVKAITVEVGEVSPLTSEELIETLESLVKWKITIIPKKAEVKCNCGYVGEPKITERMHDVVLFECPKCGKAPKVVSGNEINLVKVEV